jgi:periplasmic divalent cation tolerance protein
MPDNDVLVVLTTAPDRACADGLARSLVEERLAACVHIAPAGSSFYRWQGKLEVAQEHQLLIKTPRTLLPALVARLLVLHPYDNPEVMALPVVAGAEPYLRWVAAVGNEPTAGG